MKRLLSGAAILALAAAIMACVDMVELIDVPYDERFGEATLMDVFMPGESDGALAGERPAVLLIHGGSWRSLSKDGTRNDAIHLARAGYVTASINYRLVPEAVFPENIQDVMCALAFFQAHADEYGFDPGRVAVMGYSAGGHLASMLGVASDLAEIQPDCMAGSPAPPRAVISGAGPEDMRLLPEVDSVIEFLGGTAAEVPEHYDLASPIQHVDAGEPAFLFVHGTGDLFVDIEHSRRMRDRLRDAGNSALLLELADGGHLVEAGVSGGHAEFTISTSTPEAWLAIFDFLAGTLGAP